MNMLPIFIIGLLVGGLLVYAWCNLKINSPSALQAELQEKEIIRQKSDNKMLNDLIDKLYKKIDNLEKELNEYKK